MQDDPRNDAHLFIVNSSITLQITRSVIQHLEIRKDQVIILAGRKFRERTVNEFDLVLDLDSGEIPEVPKATRFWNRWSALRKFDMVLSQKFKGRQFHVYLPHSILPFYQLLASHASCSGFSYIEEGLVAYRSNEEVRGSISSMIPSYAGMHKWVMNGRCNMDWPFDRNAHAAYGFSGSSFSTVGLPVVVLDPNWVVSGALKEKYDRSVLCILGPANTLAKASWRPEQYYWMIMKLAEVLARTDRRIFVRFHPDQKVDERRLVHCLFADKIPNIRISDDEDQVESICASADVIVVHGGSSVGLYAEQMGIPVYGYLDLLSEVAPAAVASWKDTRDRLSYPMNEQDIRTFES